MRVAGRGQTGNSGVWLHPPSQMLTPAKLEVLQAGRGDQGCTTELGLSLRAGHRERLPCSQQLTEHSVHR